MQWSTKVILLQTVLGCICLSLLLWDARVCVVWISMFVGVTQLTFSDAIAVDALTTKYKQKINVMVGAIPFVLMLYVGLYLNQRQQKDSGSSADGESDFSLTGMLRLPLWYDGNKDDETLLVWYKNHENYLTWCMSCFQAVIFHLALFVWTSASNRYYGRQRSAMLQVGLELDKADPVNVHRLWHAVRNLPKQDQVKTKIEDLLQDLQRQAEAAAQAAEAAGVLERGRS